MEHWLLAEKELNWTKPFEERTTELDLALKKPKATVMELRNFERSRKVF